MFIEYLPYLYLFIQLLAGEIVFLIKTERRPYYVLRLILSVIVCGTASYFLGYIKGWGYWIWVVVLSMNIALVWLCYKVNIVHACVFAVIAYSLQNCAYDVTRVIFYLCDIDSIFAVEWVSLVVLAALLGLCYLLFVRNHDVREVVGIHNLKLLIVCSVVFFLVIFLHGMFNFKTAEIIGRVFLVICIMLALFLLFGVSTQAKLKREKEEIEAMLKREEALHRISKDNIDIINMKCHDLKHGLALARSGNCDPAELKEIEDALSLYDGFAKTGNDDLDIVIAEKSLRCAENGISVNCMADGEKLGFMSPGDVYSLFGNALDNAIEYLEKTDDREKRIIDVTVRERGNFVGVCVENFCNDKLTFTGGLPETSKEDKNMHGFGMKSMRYIVEKYGGTLYTEQKDEKFVLNIMFPAA